MKTILTKSLSFILTFIILFGCFFALPASALVTKGDLGTGVSWSFDFDTKNLYLTGKGEIPFYQNMSDIPWWDYRQRIREVNIEEGITKICSLVKLSNLKSITLPSSVTDIGGSAFYYCTSLETVNLPKNINYVANYAFDGCCSLKNITIEGDVNGHGNEFRGNGGGYCIRGSGRGYFVRDGVLFSNYDEYFTTSLVGTKLNHNRLELYPAGREAETYVVPSDTLWIASNAITSPVNLQTLVIPNSTQIISTYALTSLEESYEHGLNITLQHNTYPQNLSRFGFYNLPTKSRIVVKNEEVSKNFKNHYPNTEVILQTSSTTSLQLNQSNIILKINEETVIEATQTPLNTTDNLIFTSSNENIAKFDEYGFGRLTATGVGSAVITVTSGGVSAQCNITITCDHETSYIANQKDATCTKNGYTGDEICDACKTVLKPGEVITATGHDYMDLPDVPATCFEQGRVGRKECQTCGHTVSGTRVPATYHKGTCEWIVVKEATLTENGQKTYQCTVCSEVLDTEIIPMLGDGSGSNTQPTIPTPSQPTVKPIEPTTQPTTKPTITNCTHAAILKTSKQATYFEEGFTDKEICAKCNKVINNGIKQKKLKLNKPKVKIKALDNKIRIRYKKVEGANRLQVRYKIKGNWKYKIFKTNTALTKYIKNLKKGKYKVQVRAILKKSKNKVYSAWSKMKKVMVN